MALIWSLILPTVEPLPPFNLVTRPSGSDTLIAMSTPGCQPLASGHPHEEEPGLLGKHTWPGLRGSATGWDCARTREAREEPRLARGTKRRFSCFPAMLCGFLPFGAIIGGIIFYCGKIHNISFTILIIFKDTVLWHKVHFCCVTMTASVCRTLSISPN